MAVLDTEKSNKRFMLKLKFSPEILTFCSFRISFLRSGEMRGLHRTFQTRPIKQALTQSLFTCFWEEKIRHKPLGYQRAPFLLKKIKTATKERI